MCQQQIQVAANDKAANKMAKNTYSIKKVLKALFKKQQQQRKHQQQGAAPKPSGSLESLESLDNLRNSQVERQFYLEIEDNSANEKLAHMILADQGQDEPEPEQEQEDIYVPVRFARTEAGTFFWTTNLQPVTSSIAPAADEDLLQPAYCYSNCQFPRMQFRDRWAQA